MIVAVVTAVDVVWQILLLLLLMLQAEGTERRDQVAVVAG